ncbi:MAG: DUF2341 domain-containing protein [Microscillaceae bacterium]|nr:DUF2341 domain-containing protein [Microscillaceae bacterium]
MSVIIGGQAQNLPEAWKYRQAIMIDNLQSDTQIIDYQIDIDFNLRQLIEQNKLHPSGKDLRILDQDGKTFLCFWLENEVFAPQTKIWCKIPHLAAREKHTIYILYGNPQAQAVDYQACTFPLFEDFKATQIDEGKWQIRGNGNLILQDGIAYFSGNQSDIALLSQADFTMPIIVEMKVVNTTGKYLAMSLLKSQHTPVFWEGYTLALNQTTARMELALSQTETSQCGAYAFEPSGVKAKFAEQAKGVWSLSWLFRNVIMADFNGNQLLEPNTIWEIGKLKVALGVLACGTNGNPSGSMAVDWVRVRQLASTPPSIVWGNESQNPKIGHLDYFKESIG